MPGSVVGTLGKGTDFFFFIFPWEGILAWPRTRFLTGSSPMQILNACDEEEEKLLNCTIKA